MAENELALYEGRFESLYDDDQGNDFVDNEISRRGFLGDIAKYVSAGAIALTAGGLVGNEEASAHLPGVHIRIGPAKGFHNQYFHGYPYYHHFHGRPSPQFGGMYTSMSLIMLGIALSEEHKREVHYNNRTKIIVPRECSHSSSAWAEVYDRCNNNQRAVFFDNEQMYFRIHANKFRGHTAGLVLFNPRDQYFYAGNKRIDRTFWSESWGYEPWDDNNLKKVTKRHGEGNYKASFFIDDVPIAMRWFTLKRS